MHLLIVGTSKGTAKKVKRQKERHTRKKCDQRISAVADLGTYYCDMYRGHGNTQGMRGVRKQLHTAGGTNIWQPSRTALNSNTAVQQS